MLRDVLNLCAVIGGLLDYFFLVCPKCNIFIKKDNVVLLPRSQKCNFQRLNVWFKETTGSGGFTLASKF